MSRHRRRVANVDPDRGGRALTHNPHLDTAPGITGPPAGEAAAAAILVHGRGHGAETTLDLAGRRALDDVHFVLPAAAGSAAGSA